LQTPKTTRLRRQAKAPQRGRKPLRSPQPPPPATPDVPQVERVRRAHLNDLENILPFFAIGLLYVAVAQPSESAAKAFFLTFTFSRLLHTLSYLLLKAPAVRALAFTSGLVCNLAMAVQVINAAL
jgi:glutathione S-transferase